MCHQQSLTSEERYRQAELTSSRYALVYPEQLLTYEISPLGWVLSCFLEPPSHRGSCHSKHPGLGLQGVAHSTRAGVHSGQSVHTPLRLLTTQQVTTAGKRRRASQWPSEEEPQSLGGGQPKGRLVLGILPSFYLFRIKERKRAGYSFLLLLLPSPHTNL